MTPTPNNQRLKALEESISDIQKRLDVLEGLASSVAPLSEVDRLNLAFDLIADKAPASEVDRLNLAFDLIAGKAPASEVDRLNLAFELISELDRLSRSIVGLSAFTSERVVEVPWVLGKYQGEGRVLDIGYAFAEDHYLRSLGKLGIPQLVGIDAAESPRPAELLAPILQVRGDVLHNCFRPASFDLVLCVSTIEHIGRDNTIYGLDRGKGREDPDLEAISTIGGWLAPGGRLLLSVPFGRYEDHGWLINYDMDRLTRLLDASKLDLVEMSFFGWRPGGWHAVHPDELANRGYQALGASHASGVALVEMRQKESP